jgi:hypothetical protein
MAMARGGAGSRTTHLRAGWCASSLSYCIYCYCYWLVCCWFIAAMLARVWQAVSQWGWLLVICRLSIVTCYINAIDSKKLFINIIMCIFYITYEYQFRQVGMDKMTCKIKRYSIFIISFSRLQRAGGLRPSSPSCPSTRWEQEDIHLCGINTSIHTIG